MSFTLLAAISENNALGKDNTLLWRLPADLKHFKETTKNHTVVMGRKTFLSIGKLLPERENVILTRDKDFSYAGAKVLHSIEKLKREYEKSDDEVFIIGGGEIYIETLPFAQKLIITHVHKKFDGDTFFPVINKNEWFLVSEKRSEADEYNALPMTIAVYTRKGY
jgi:dihydrofolate reductase